MATMLRPGQVFHLNGARWRVAYVNESRAHCVSVATRTVTVRDRRTGQERTFQAHSRETLDISPNSELEVLRG